jgi:hypothetical protein
VEDEFSETGSSLVARPDASILGSFEPFTCVLCCVSSSNRPIKELPIGALSFKNGTYPVVSADQGFRAVQIEFPAFGRASPVSVYHPHC